VVAGYRAESQALASIIISIRWVWAIGVAGLGHVLCPSRSWSFPQPDVSAG
jgi:hypothetical protein